MASTYSSNLKIELITTGEQTNTWGTTTNNNLGTALEEAIVGYGNPNFASDADLTLTLSNSNSTQTARNFVLNVTSSLSLTSTWNLIVPTIEKPYVVQNNTTGGQSIVVKTSAGTGVTVPNGKSVFVYTDGTNVVSAINHVPTVTLGTALALSSGGTGATDASTARTNLGLAIGTNVQAYDAELTAIAALAVTDGNIIVGNGSTWVAESGATARTSLGLGTSDDVQFDSFGVGTAASGTTGEIRATDNVTAYYSSDRKFKENIKPIEGALSKVTAIGGKTFDWTDDYIVSKGGADGYFIQKSDFGVIAQDVQAVFPQAVRTREDGSLAVDYEKLSALSFAAIKELAEEVKKLKGQ